MMEFTIHPIQEEDARQMAAWRYEEPYAIYSPSEEDIPVLLDPKNRYHGVRDGSSRLVGSCCFGRDARVPGGDYAEGEPEVLDVGVGMHPKLVGKGHGGAFVGEILKFAAGAFEPARFRVTIAEFNQRSQKVFLGLGFTKTGSFKREGDGMRFVQLEREVC